MNRDWIEMERTYKNVIDKVLMTRDFTRCRSLSPKKTASLVALRWFPHFFVLFRCFALFFATECTSFSFNGLLRFAVDVSLGGDLLGFV